MGSRTSGLMSNMGVAEASLYCRIFEFVSVISLQGILSDSGICLCMTRSSTRSKLNSHCKQCFSKATNSHTRVAVQAD
jgi:hypothetical protein